MSSQATDPNSNANACEICGQKFTNTDELHQHKTQVHQGQNPNSNAGQ